MPRVSVAEAAVRLGVNVQRVHQRISDGSLAAERVGHQWTIDEAVLARLDRRPAGRPLSARSAWAMVQVAAVGRPSPGLTSVERSRARARVRELFADAARLAAPQDEESAAEALGARLRALLRGRAGRRLFRVSPSDLDDLRHDQRVNLSGVSLPGSGIASGAFVEGYVPARVVDDLVEDFLLVEAVPRDADVVLHVVDPTVVGAHEVEPADWLLLAADLAEHQRPRETARAAHLVREAAGRDPGAASNGHR